MTVSALKIILLASSKDTLQKTRLTDPTLADGQSKVKPYQSGAENRIFSVLSNK